MTLVATRDFPERFVQLKKQLAESTPDGKERLTTAWNEILGELKKTTQVLKETGSNYLPQVDFSEINTLSSEKIAEIKKCGCVVVRNVVDDEEVIQWKQAVKEYATANPSVPGFPDGNKQFFHMYWSKSQIKARSHPNVIASQIWLNSLYHGEKPDVLQSSLAYADRLRLRQPGPEVWDAHPPHIDGGGIERWEDTGFRKVNEEILAGNWKAHDPYDLGRRLQVNTNLYNRPGQSTIFRTFQGWLAMSDTKPNEGTLQGESFTLSINLYLQTSFSVFPDVKLSNSYLILRPFFRPVEQPVSTDSLDPQNWEFNTSTPDFPGIYPVGEYYLGPRPNDKTHPHLKLSETMISVPHVKPGDMVFWHCDLIHAVEFEHHGQNDSSVMYIAAVPATPTNKEYILKQKEHFLVGKPPPDFLQDNGETGFSNLGNESDIVSDLGRIAMGLVAA